MNYVEKAFNFHIYKNNNKESTANVRIFIDFEISI